MINYWNLREAKKVAEYTAPVNELSDKKVKQYLKKARKSQNRYSAAGEAGERFASQGGKDAEYWKKYADDMNKKYDSRTRMIKKVRGRVESVNELSTNTLRSYADKAMKAHGDLNKQANPHISAYYKSSSLADRSKDPVKKSKHNADAKRHAAAADPLVKKGRDRLDGVMRARQRIAKSDS